MSFYTFSTCEECLDDWFRGTTDFNIFLIDLSCKFFLIVVLQRSFHMSCDATLLYIDENIACSIDLHYLSAALCRGIKRSRPAQDSRREPSASKFSFQWTNTAAAAIINSPSTSLTSLLSLLLRPQLIKRLRFLPPLRPD